MGTIAHLCVDDYPLLGTKNELDPVVLTIFRESDRRTYTRRIRDRSPLIYSRVDSDEEEQVIEYATTVAWASRRLDIMGFTMSRCRREYEATRKALITEIEFDADDDATHQSVLLDDYDKKRLGELNRINFDAYVEGLRHILANRLLPDPFDDRHAPGLSVVVTYLLDVDDDCGTTGSSAKIRVAFCAWRSPSLPMIRL
jgi:hypothetical protein